MIIVSFNDSHWLEGCLSSLRQRAGDRTLDVIVVDNGSDGAHQFVRTRFPDVRVLQTENRGFAHANNRAAMISTGRYVLFLNPDTAVVDGTLGDLVDKLDRHPDVGLVGVRQITGDGQLHPTIRYFPNAGRALGDSLGCERWRQRPRWAGERELDCSLYERETDCDWTSGSFLFVRREALLTAGLLDERFFLFSEETDLCLRVKRAGWRIVHLPVMTIVHHAGKGGIQPALTAQNAFSCRQYANKHFATPHRVAYLTAVASGYILRAAVGRKQDRARESARSALRALVGTPRPPFVVPPATAMTPEEAS